MSQPQPKPQDNTPQELFQHFDSEEARQQFLRDVAEAQKNGTVPF